MKPVKTFVSVAVLVLALAVNAPAGEQQTPGKNTSTPPPPEPIISTYDGAPTLYDPNNEQSEVTPETSDYLWYELVAALLSIY